MLRLSIPFGGQDPLTQRMSVSDDTDQPIPEQRLTADFGTDQLIHHSGFKIDPTVTQRFAVLSQFLQEIEAHTSGVSCHSGQERGAEVVDKAVAGPKGESPDQFFDIKSFIRTKNGLDLTDQRVNPVAKRKCPRRRNQAASRSYKQGISGRLAESRQCTAHGRRAELQSPGSARHTLFSQEYVQSDEQVEIGR
jgi:hypothetical protein